MKIDFYYFFLNTTIIFCYIYFIQLGRFLLVLGDLSLSLSYEERDRMGSV